MSSSPGKPQPQLLLCFLLKKKAPKLLNFYCRLTGLSTFPTSVRCPVSLINLSLCAAFSSLSLRTGTTHTHGALALPCCQPEEGILARPECFCSLLPRALARCQRQKVYHANGPRGLWPSPFVNGQTMASCSGWPGEWGRELNWDVGWF